MCAPRSLRQLLTALPLDLLNKDPCLVCGSGERWQWLDGRLLCRVCLVLDLAPLALRRGDKCPMDAIIPKFQQDTVKKSRVTLRDVKRRRLIATAIYDQDEAGKRQPTKQGIALTVEEWPDLQEALARERFTCRVCARFVRTLPA
jgi:hypothetical protein